MIKDGKDVGGRPSVYTSDMPDLVLKSMMMGLRGARLFAVLGISKAVFYKYLKQYTELNEAYERGKDLAEAWWENKGIEYMEEGAKEKFNYWKTLVDRNFGATPTGAAAQQINIGQMTVNQVTSKEDYLQLLEDVRDKARELNVIDIIPEELESGRQEDPATPRLTREAPED